MTTSWITEARNPRTYDIDTVSSADRLKMILREDAAAVEAAHATVPVLARMADETVERIQHGGRIHYVGAGASGRLAGLDATEATPTFGVSPDLVTAHFPGGIEAFHDSTIDLEDAQDQGCVDLSGLSAMDVVIGLSASGATSYVRGGLESATTAGALTALITSNPQGPLLSLVDFPIVVETGPEALAGSTRLKAGTAVKVLLNAFSTSVMIGLGRTYSNLMIQLVASNEKLRERSIALLIEASERPDAECRRVLMDCAGRVPLALVCLLSGASPREAETAMQPEATVRSALDQLADHR